MNVCGSCLLGIAICSALSVVHAFTGFDYTSVFLGVKVNAVQLTLESPA